MAEKFLQDNPLQTGQFRAIKNVSLLDSSRFVSDSAIVWRDGIIEYAGPSHQLPSDLQHLDFEDGKGRWVCPAFVNGHTHVAMSFLRDVAHAFPHMIDQLFFPLEKHLTPQMVSAFSRPSIAAGIRSGVTTFVDHYYHAEAVQASLTEMGVRGWLGETIADLGGAMPVSQNQWQDRALNRQDGRSTAGAHESKFKTVIAPHAMDTVSPSLMTELAEYARSNHLPLHFHLSQTNAEREKCLSRHQLSPVELAQKCKALGSRTLAVHLITASSRDIEILASTQTFVGLCPTSQTLYEHVAPVADFFKAGLKGILGTDCAASHDTMDIWQELKFLYLTLKAQKSAATAQEMLKTVWDHPHEWMQTKGGKIESGYWADLIFVEPSFNDYPVLSPHVHFIMSMSSQNIVQVVSGGETIMKHGQFGFDSHVAHWQAEFDQGLKDLRLHEKLSAL